MGRFDGQIALVTGSTLGLGEAIARRLVTEGVGGMVVTGRDEARGRAVASDLAISTDAMFVACELGDPAPSRRSWRLWTNGLVVWTS